MHPGDTTDERPIPALHPTGSRPLTRARLRPPPLRSLPRERLLKAMGTGVDHRLTLVTGPAGSGKTTLLAQFAEQHPGATAWYRADVEDGNPAVLLGHVAHALAGVVPDLPAGWRTVDDALAALDRTAPHGDGNGTAPTTVVLALDDLHVIVGTPAERVLGSIVDELPPWLRLAAACREAPHWNLSRLRVSGALFEVGADDLRFRSWEVERLFCDIYGEPLPPGDLAQLTRGLEGWAAGLQLFHLATREKPVSEQRRAVAALPARSTLVREYLSGNVLDQLPEAQTTFLVDTSVVGRLSPALCDELRGTTGSRQILDDLEARQVFVTRLDGEDAYRYHEVFRSYLERRLVERDGEAAARDRAARAAALLEADGSLADALRAHCRAADWASVGRVLEKGGAELAADPGEWLDALPRSLVDDDPWVMLATARRAVATGRFTAALGIYDRIARAHASDPAEAAGRRERSELAAWIDPAATPHPGWPGRVRQALRGPATPVPAVPPDPGGPAGDRLAAGIVALVQGEAGAAAEILTTVADDPGASDVLAAGARLALAVAHALEPDAVTDVDAADLLELVELAEVPWLTWMAKAAAALSGTAAGLAHAEKVAEMLGRQNDAWGSALARLFAALGAARAGAGGGTIGDPGDGMGALCADLRGLDAPVLADRVQSWQVAPPGTPPVRVRALGGFSLEIAGRQVDLGDTRPRVRSVLRYLATRTGRPAHVETMVAALWPDVDAAAGKRNLQVALSSLRKLLDGAPPHGRELIRREGPSYAFVLPDGAEDDLATVAAALDAARARARSGDARAAVAAGQRALDAYAGELLPEEGPADWAVERRRALDGEIVEGAVLVAEQALAAACPEAATAACGRGLDVDRYHDGLWRLLVRAQEAGGDLAAAARTHERYLSVLSELGVDAR